MNLKSWSSCIRDREFGKRNIEWGLKTNGKPLAGDILLAEIEDEYGYQFIENCHGRDVRVFSGDILAFVLGNRFSGTNNYGQVPEGPLESGMRLSILSQSGIAGQCLGVDGLQTGSRPKTIRILGFPSDGDGGVLNIAGVNSHPERFTGRFPQRRIVFIFGTSAESGKTTLACNLILALNRILGKGKIACFKIAGTGRLKDSLVHMDAGARVIKDFVDFGFPSTYGVSAEKYQRFLNDLLGLREIQDSEFVLMEVGGDLLEANAPEALAFSARMGFQNILVANDAMGASMGVQMITSAGIPLSHLHVGCLKNNSYSMERRLGQKVFAIGKSDDMSELGGKLLSSGTNQTD